MNFFGLFVTLMFYLKLVNATAKVNIKDGFGSVITSVAECLNLDQKFNCLKDHLLQSLDAALYNNNTWYYGEALTFEKLHGKHELESAREGKNLLPVHSLSDEIANKLIQIAQSRTMNLHLPKMLTLLPSISGSISNAVDSFFVNDSGMIDEEIYKLKKYKIKQLSSYKPPLKGRKKKEKDKMIFAMGGMTILAMLAQMFLGKVLLIAGAAFVMAKIALISSFLGHIKKSFMGHTGGGTEHIIYTSHDVAAPVHHDSSGWQRKTI